MKRTFFFAGLIVVLCLHLTSNSFAAADGWASMNGGTTGGQGGPTVTVTDEPNLIKYATSATAGPYIIQVSGTINIPTDDGDDNSLQISANKTLRGIGTNPTLIGCVGFKNRDRNIIVENLNITNPHAGEKYDGMSVTQDINNVLITKCTFYDCGDGCLDISNRSDYITVSWCKFYYTSSAPDPTHCFSSLVGARDSATDDANYLRVTYHHNWWTTLCKERMPRVRYGQVHVYNNYYSNLTAGGYCIGVGCGSRIRVENNYFDTVPNPWKDYYSDYPTYPVGHIGWNTDNIYYNCTEPTWATNEYDTIFTPPYAYMLYDTNDIPAIVQAYAGAGTPYPPHWYYTVYGDFNHNYVVDTNDLKLFADDYWLVNDPNHIADGDYNGDGKVNFYEFSLLAEDWLQEP